MSKEEEAQRETTEQLLKQLRGLIILQLRNSKVEDTAIGNMIGTKAKSVRDKYPLTKKEAEEAGASGQSPSPETHGTESSGSGTI